MHWKQYLFSCTKNVLTTTKLLNFVTAVPATAPNRGSQKRAYLLQTHIYKILEAGTERAFEFRRRRLGDEKQHAHRVQVCMWGCSCCHLQRKQQPHANTTSAAYLQLHAYLNATQVAACTTAALGAKQMRMHMHSWAQDQQKQPDARCKCRPTMRAPQLQ